MEDKQKNNKFDEALELANDIQYAIGKHFMCDGERELEECLWITFDSLSLVLAHAMKSAEILEDVDIEFLQESFEEALQKDFVWAEKKIRSMQDKLSN